MPIVAKKKAAPKAPAVTPAKAVDAPALEAGAHIQQDEGVFMARLSRYASGVAISEDTVEERVPTPKFEGPVARTRVAGGCTKSMGGFEFVRIDVMVEMPCYPNPQDLDETNEFASQKVTEYMTRELASIMTAPAPTAEVRRANMSALMAPTLDEELDD